MLILLPGCFTWILMSIHYKSYAVTLVVTEKSIKLSKGMILWWCIRQPSSKPHIREYQHHTTKTLCCADFSFNLSCVVWQIWNSSFISPTLVRTPSFFSLIEPCRLKVRSWQLTIIRRPNRSSNGFTSGSMPEKSSLWEENETISIRLIRLQTEEEYKTERTTPIKR